MNFINNFFTDAYMCFENSTRVIDIPFSNDINNNNNNNFHFGVVNLNTISCPITTKEQEFIFVIDRSGSMSDKCKDGKTKTQHIIHTLKNMIHYFHDNNINNIHITIFAFDDNFVNIIERTRITNDNLQNIINTIDQITPNGTTNIQKALIEVGLYIDLLVSDYPYHIVNNIFMTDGEATCGSKNVNTLKQLINSNTNITNSFIGFGLEHDSYLLNFISNNNNSSYYFIDAIENSGLVYGEILHGILYKLLKNVEINIQNGLIYDFKKNIWQEKLYIGDIVGESNKIYHIISKYPNDTNIYITFKEVNEFNDKDEDSISNIEINKLINLDSDYTKYFYRQKTLELLFMVQKFQTEENYNGNSDNSHDNSDDNSNVKHSENVSDNETYVSEYDEVKYNRNTLKKKLLNLFEEIKKHMNNYDLNEDKFLKNLCDDLYVSYCTFGTKHGAMYSAARQTSQGSQRCYTVNNTPHYNDLRRNNRRRFSHSNHYLDVDTDLDLSLDIDIINDINNNNNNYDILNHTVSNFNNTPYLSSTATQVMRDISGFYDLELDDESNISNNSNSSDFDDSSIMTQEY